MKRLRELPSCVTVAAWALLGIVAESGRAERTVYDPPLDVALIDSYPDDVLTADSEAGEDCGIVIAARQDYPRLMLNTNGPTATVRSLAFSPDSSRIYAAGLDKTVHAWGVRQEARGLRRTTMANQAVPVQSLRWEITRGLRGAVYAIAASPTNREIAVAGYSARDATGDIVVIDSSRQTVVRSLHGHMQAVAFLDYSPDGSRLASVARDGEIRVWSDENDWQSKVLRTSAGPETQFQPIKFLDDNTLAISHPVDDAGSSWRLALIDVTADDPQPRVLSQPHAERITCLALADDGRLASADWKGNAYLWTKADDGLADPPRLLRKGRMALCMDFAPDGRLFIATARTETTTDGRRISQSVLERWDAANARLLDQVQTATADHNFVCRVSPDGSRVVTYGGDNNELLVFLLKDRTGEEVDNPLGQRPLRIRGAGRKRTFVAFEEGGYRVGFGSGGATEPQKVFDLGDPQIVRVNPGELKWRNRNSDANGWELRVLTGPPVKLAPYFEGQPRGTITLDPQRHGNVRNYCWLAKEGKTYGVAVATDVQNGVYVFGASGQGQEWPMLRYFRDHNDIVTSLCASSDGKYLASCSGDQTVKVWSLEGVEKPAEGFAKEAGWGTTFAIENGKLVVGSVLQAGTAARKGIRPGDVIVEGKFSPDVSIKLGKGDDFLTTADPQTLLDALQQAPLTENVLLTIQRRGMQLNQKILLVPAWEPLATLFVSEADEWALWTPQGYYDASVAGDELFGWLMNRGVSQRADFYRADQFRFELERPEVLRKVLSLGSVPAALRDSKHPIPEAPDAVVDASVRKKPRVTILNPYDGAEIADQVIRVRAMVEFPDVSAAQQIRGAAFVNGVPGKVVEEQTARLRRTYEWNVPLSDVYNRLRVVAEDVDPERMVNFSDVHFRLQAADAPESNPKLHLVTLAATDYQNVAKLECSIRDALAIANELGQTSKAFYEQGMTLHLHNEDANRERLLQEIDAIKTAMENGRPDDLLVLFLAGHGIAMDGEYYFVPIDADLETLKEVGIAWADIRKLGEIACRKLVLLDTCHSGSVLPMREVGAGNWKDAIRPLKMDEFLVLSATDVGQEALEFGEHGIFTQCILEALRGEGAEDPQAVYLQDVVRYVESEVPRRTARLQLQTPKSSPTALFNVISVPLATPAN